MSNGAVRDSTVDIKDLSYSDEYSGRGRLYCRFCRRGMGQKGDIGKYVRLITNYRLEKEDVAVVKRLLQDTGICNKCYRPYKRFSDGSTNRLNRVEIQLEVASYWVFLCCVYVPMMAAILIPALIVGITTHATKHKKDSRIPRERKKMRNKQGRESVVIT